MKIKWMKLSIMMLLTCTFILAACGQSSDKTTGSESKKVISIGTDAAFAPFEYMKKGNIVGFDVDLIDAVAKEAGYTIDMKNTGFDPMFASLKQKEIDMGVSGITITDKRKQTYDFSKPYFEAKQIIVVKEGSKLKNAKDLKNLKIGVQSSTTGEAAVEEMYGKNAKNIKKYDTTALAFLALDSGDVDAVVADNVVAEEYVKNNPNKKVKTIEDDTNFSPEYYGFAFPKGSDLKKKLDDALATVMDNGKYEEIYKHWFKVSPDVEKIKSVKE